MCDIAASTLCVDSKKRMKEFYCANYSPLKSCSVADWVGEYDSVGQHRTGTTAFMRRWIDLHSGQLEVGGSDDGKTCWGRRCDPETEVNPVFDLNSSNLCEAQISFASKVPPTSPDFEETQLGA